MDVDLGGPNLKEITPVSNAVSSLSSLVFALLVEDKVVEDEESLGVVLKDIEAVADNPLENVIIAATSEIASR